MKKLTLPAGKYYIGDPCYVIGDHEKWMSFLESCDFFEASNEASIGDDKFWAGSTAYGDGIYGSNIGVRFSVDAGLIGIVPASVVEKYADRDDTSIEHLGTFVTFDAPFEVKFNPRAGNAPTHVFGHIEIFTDGDESEEDHGYENDEDDGYHD